jgi:hypothetical protein
MGTPFDATLILTTDHVDCEERSGIQHSRI